MVRLARGGRFVASGTKAERTCFIVDTHGGYLFSYDAGWLEHGDDPTCWCSGRDNALRMTADDAAQLLPAVQQWHDAKVQS